jgi:hypothetical protein
MTGRRQVFEIAADRAPVSVVLDPDFWVLMDAEFAESPAYPPNSTISGKSTAGKSDRQEQQGS